MPDRFRGAASACAIIAVCSTFLFLLTKQPVAFASSEDALKRGAIAFHTKGCERCHSITGVGGDRAADLGAVGLRRKPTKIKSQILEGGGGMPPFKSVLTKNEVSDLVVFLTSCRTEMAPGCREWGAPQ